MLIVTASEMATMDKRTIEEIGIPGMVLMENAARGAAAFFLEVMPDLASRRICVLAGLGNNAGDGFVLARLFHGKGADVRVVCLQSPAKLIGEAAVNFDVLRKIGVPIEIWDESADFACQWRTVAECGVVIDAILGTGLKGEVRGVYREVIEALNCLPMPVLSVDIPTGLDSTTGRPLGVAVRATATATFGYVKLGQVVECGNEYVGRLSVIDIGIPPMVAERSGVRRWWIDDELVSEWLQPRAYDAHKGDAGHVGVLAGSKGKTGAAALVCNGAARAGAGLVTLFIPASLNTIMEAKLTEPMTYPIPETDDQSPGSAAAQDILTFLDGKQAFAMGPGITTHPDTEKLIKALIPKLPCPTVVDADAITVLAGQPKLFQKAIVPLILTPHPGEMARLIRGSNKTVQENRLDIAAEFSKKYGVTVVLKGFRTVVASPDGRLAVNSTGNPAMASGGMGDILTGLIAGFLAQGHDPFQASCLGVYVHGEAADRRFGKVASRGLLASEVLEEVPRVIGGIEGIYQEC